MNKTKIEWVRNPDGTQGYTWNPIVGCTGTKCAVAKECYARRTAKRFRQRCSDCYEFKPHLHPKRLGQTNTRKPRGIFVCSMGDLFDTNLVTADKYKVLREIIINYWNRYYLLTKQPQNLGMWRDYFDLRLCWIGVTVNRRSDLWRIDELRKNQSKVRFISFEPLMEDLGEVNLEGINWIIIGAQTKPEVQPPELAVSHLAIQAEKLEIPVFCKNNLGCLWKPRQEFPKV